MVRMVGLGLLDRFGLGFFHEGRVVEPLRQRIAFLFRGGLGLFKPCLLRCDIDHAFERDDEHIGAHADLHGSTRRGGFKPDSGKAGEAFDPQRSDIDFLVDFGPGAQPDLFNRYFGLNEALTALFGRKVDLVMPGGMVNPYVIETVNRTRQPVYARPLTEAA